MVLINGKDFTQADVLALKELAAMFVEKNDPGSTTPNATPLYGPNQSGPFAGLLALPGVRPEMYSALVHPRSIARFLGVRSSRIANEKIGIITGQTAASGSNPTNYCGDPPMAGNLKRCVQNYQFGRWYMKTKLNVLPEMGEFYDRSDMEKIILNQRADPNPFIPDLLSRINVTDREGLQLANELYAIGNELERTLEPTLIQGNATLAPANTKIGWIKEFDGLERQIVTGRVDMDTQTPCPAADSTLITWGASIDATVSGRTFPQVLVDTYFGKVELANSVGMDNVRFAWLMPMRLFRALTYVYACTYWTSRCDGSAANPQVTESQEIRRLQLEMWNGRYLLMDGVAVQVIFTDGIPETRASGSIYTADEVMLVPIEWNGRRFLNIEFKPMDNADIVAFDNFAGLKTVSSINNGMMLVGKRDTGFCKEYLFAMKPRLILDAPFLAARISTVQYTYSAPYRSAFPSDTINYVDGGAHYWAP